MGTVRAEYLQLYNLLQFTNVISSKLYCKQLNSYASFSSGSRRFIRKRLEMELKLCH